MSSKVGKSSDEHDCWQAIKALELENAELKNKVGYLQGRLTIQYSELQAENAALKSRITAMEGQEPVARINVTKRKLDWIHPPKWETGICAVYPDVLLYAAPTTAMLDKARDEENEACARIFVTLGCLTYAEAIRARRVK